MISDDAGLPTHEAGSELSARALNSIAGTKDLATTSILDLKTAGITVKLFGKVRIT